MYFPAFRIGTPLPFYFFTPNSNVLAFHVLFWGAQSGDESASAGEIARVLNLLATIVERSFGQRL